MRRTLTFLLIIGPGGCRVDSVTFTQSVADAALDTPMVQLEHHHYVIDHLQFPTTNVEARNDGLDLNGDGTVDNQLGMVVSTLVNMGIENQAYTNTLIDRGGAIMLADLGVTDLVTSSSANFTLFQGKDPMPAPCLNGQDNVCRKHLTGSGSFTAKTSPVDPPLEGTVAGGDLVAGPGHLTVQFAFFGPSPLQLTLLGARVDLMPTSTVLTGKLAGAISKPDVDNVIIPAMQSGFVPIVTRDCTMLANPPGCGCATGSQGKDLIGIFDTTPHDCAISVAEVRDNPLITSLFAPDLNIEGRDALSFGVLVHAVGATYTGP